MSQRDRLLGRRIPPTPVAIRIDFGPDADAAYAEHESALRDLETAEARGADYATAKALVDETRAALAPFQEVLQVSPIPPSVYDALIDEHPPTDEQREQGYTWNPDTFGPAMLAACIGQDLAPDERMSEKDWIDWASTAAAGHAEYVLLVNTCLAVNDRTLNVHVGKG